jgi:hypothetical protein
MVRRFLLAAGMAALALGRAVCAFKVLSNSSLGEMPLATPAVSRGSLAIRTASRLSRIAGEPS